MQKEKQKELYSLVDILGQPMLQEEARDILRKDLETYRMFLEFPEDERKALLAFICGERGLKITYDTFFKRIMDPDIHPKRLEQFLSAVLNQKVRICTVLPREGSKMAAGGSLVIMDIVVELSDGSIIDVEMQKIGYAFPGERSSCYIADFIMRQYNRVKSEREKKFSFRDLKPVYLIILMENSSKEFSLVYPQYIHREQNYFDSGAKVKTLGNIIYISLDTFRSVVQNINTELDAWLSFFSADSPERIVQVVNAYPEFLSCYKEMMEFRANPKELIMMYSEALAIMDHNTAEYMCEEMQKTIKEQADTISMLQEQIATMQAEMEELKKK